MTEKYYPAFLDLKKAGESSYFIINRNDSQTQIKNNFEVNLFKALSGSRTIDEHLKSIVESDEYIIEKSVLSEIIINWIKTGFLRNEELLFKQSANNKNQSHSYNRQKIISGCITSNRPDMLNRWLKSRLDTIDYLKRKTPIIICDDTEIGEIKKSNKSITYNYMKKYPGKIYYIDEKKKITLSKMINSILPEIVPMNLIDFSLSLNQYLPNKKTPGSNRNALLLISAGLNIYSSDDDIEYKFFSNSIENKNYSFPDKKILSPLFFPDMDTVTKQFRKIENFDLINQFENLIASNISTLLNHKYFVSMENITPKTAMLQERGQLKIRTVSTGYCGGRWYQNPYRPLIQQNKEREDFFYDYKKYRQIRDNGLNIMSADKHTIVTGGSLMGGTLCLNNKDILPPCFPMGMRDDTCFSILLDICFESSLNIHLPIALYHNPVEKPPFLPEDFQDISVNTGTYSILILEKLSSYFIHPKGRERLKELGVNFKNFGKMKASDFEEQLKLMQLGFLAKSMAHISYLLEIYEGKPSWWAEDMEKYYKLLKREALSSDSVVPRELRCYSTKEEALAVFKDYIFKCGEMLYWWPEIWEAARDINLEGRGLINLKDY